MKASVITAILAFSVSAMAAPLASPATDYAHWPKTSTRSLVAKRSTAQALSDCQTDECRTVVTAITGWDFSVNIVNAFLNSATSLPVDQTLTDVENTALDFANLEPGFLGTLKATPGLSAAGLAAAATLGDPTTGVFPQVPANLKTLLDGSGTTVQFAVDQINAVRCSQILTAISTLWVEAAAAAGADTPGLALGPNQCPKPGGQVGNAYN